MKRERILITGWGRRGKGKRRRKRRRRGHAGRGDRFKWRRVKKETAGNEHGWSEEGGCCSSVRYRGRSYKDWWKYTVTWEQKILKTWVRHRREHNKKKKKNASKIKMCFVSRLGWNCHLRGTSKQNETKERNKRNILSKHPGAVSTLKTWDINVHRWVKKTLHFRQTRGNKPSVKRANCYCLSMGAQTSTCPIINFAWRGNYTLKLCH